MDQKTASLKARREFKERLRHGLVARPVLQTCDHCGQQIASDMEWCCGYCNYENRRTTLYSFLYKCQKCDGEPKSYVCPQCGKVSFLDEDKDSTHPAKKAVKAPKAEPPRDLEADSRKEKRKAHEGLVEDTKREIEIAELKARLAQINALQEGKKEETIREKMKKRLKRKMDQHMGAFDAAEECRKEADEEYKDDPERQQEARDVIKHFLEDESLGGLAP